MELSIYDIIKRKLATEKSQDMFRKFGKLTFEVHKAANKIMVREAVEKIWDVKVDNVRIVSCPGKNKVFARKNFKSPDRKKAIITLKKGYKIDLPGHFETMGVPETQGEKETSIEGK
jgi:large subunit ribosomal protein L23